MGVDWLIVCYQEHIGRSRERAEEAFKAFSKAGFPTVLLDASSMLFWCASAYGEREKLESVDYPEPDDWNAGRLGLVQLLDTFAKIVKASNFKTRSLKEVEKLVREMRDSDEGVQRYPV